jgi:hypothetical protein
MIDFELDERVSDVAGTQNILTGGTQDIRCVSRRVSRTGDRLHAFDNLLAVLDKSQPVLVCELIIREQL